jgi:hypothetical protein
MELLRKRLVKINLVSDIRMYDKANAWRFWSTSDLMAHYSFWSSEVTVPGWSKQHVEQMYGMLRNRTKTMRYIKTMMVVAAFVLAIGSAHAQYLQYGPVENFYQANPDINTSQYAGRAVNPSYWLTDSSR